MSDTWTLEHAPDTRWIRVRYATWRIVDHIVGQRLQIQLVHGLDTADCFYRSFSFLGLKNPTFALLSQRHNFFSKTQNQHTRNWFGRLRSERLRLRPDARDRHAEPLGKRYASASQLQFFFLIFFSGKDQSMNKFLGFFFLSSTKDCIFFF